MSDSKERRSGLTGQESVVSRLVKQAEERQREQATAGRGKAEHGGKLGRDKTGRDKATYDVSVERQELIRVMAQREDVSQADIVEAAIVGLYNAWRTGQVSLEDLKTPARSLKSKWKLTIPEDFSFFTKQCQH